MRSSVTATSRMVGRNRSNISSHVALGPVPALRVPEMLAHLVDEQDVAKVLLLELPHGGSNGGPVHLHAQGLKDLLEHDHRSLDRQAVIVICPASSRTSRAVDSSKASLPSTWFSVN